jgi:hypothetical protein
LIYSLCHCAAQISNGRFYSAWTSFWSLINPCRFVLHCIAIVKNKLVKDAFTVYIIPFGHYLIPVACPTHCIVIAKSKLVKDAFTVRGLPFAIAKNTLQQSSFQQGVCQCCYILSFSPWAKCSFTV